MADAYDAPEMVRPIPDQQATIGTQYTLDAREFIQHPLGTKVYLHFSAYSEDGFPLPKGLVCDADGQLTGVPAKGTYRPQGYLIIIEAETDLGANVRVGFKLMILNSIRLDKASTDQSDTDIKGDYGDNDFDAAIGMDQAETEQLLERLDDEVIGELEIDRDKKKVWQAILSEADIPTIQSLLDREVTYQEVYHLLSRFAYLAIWNADDLNRAGELQRLLLEGASDQFDVYDRGACMVAAPKQLFDHHRSLQQAVDTAQALGREALRRGWRVEFGGYDKMIRAAWVEMEAVAEQQNKATAYVHYFPSAQDYELLHTARQKLTG